MSGEHLAELRKNIEAVKQFIAFDREDAAEYLPSEEILSELCDGKGEAQGDNLFLCGGKQYLEYGMATLYDVQSKTESYTEYYEDEEKERYTEYYEEQTRQKRLFGYKTITVKKSRPAERTVKVQKSRQAERTITVKTPKRMAAGFYDITAVLAVIAAQPKKLANGNYQFGNYPQGANGEVAPIEWRIIEKKNGEAVLLSEKILDCRQYHETPTDITWFGCALRKWLNNEFVKEAFTPQETSNILTITSSNNADGITNDKVWLLSVDEAKKLGDDNSRQAEGTPFAEKNNLCVDDDGKYGAKGKGYWWLRSHGSAPAYAAYVVCNGLIADEGFEVCLDCNGVRAAVRVRLS